MKLFDWAAPGPYRVAFSTRLGGVSEGPYESLNLGLLTSDEPERVRENRRRLCAHVGADPDSATMAMQRHGARVTRADGRGVAHANAVFETCDGLWTDMRGEAVMLIAADCLPIALCRDGGRPALAVLHVGWKGLLEGIAEAGAAAIRGGAGRLTAAIGPGIGRCCYEVGEEVATPYRERFGADVLQGRYLDLPGAAERALRAAGVDAVERSDLCTACRPDLFFSHRRDGGVTGRHGVIAYVAE
jgi:polyphenol oxidase